ncbi:uncharacterized protein RHIMIDRAFT_272203 [Rhizopus microsporus ATCC 52813]|uniref:Uncharacterized protein n=1 Tax=Rhizopus microsporus ATCC 52813 TaxID=1340429 RepID=A0A2G4T3U8_RHIZD|nr:uncharacterized protein RHIMIDRAFT_272203 [Rhizopus microsporus ATCC 52813]PHZ15356.1 hypothetical protein RHIMIDRAFT_272203 [Rhizopus microsporus ATCC 52813]
MKSCTHTSVQHVMLTCIACTEESNSSYVTSETLDTSRNEQCEKGIEQLSQTETVRYEEGGSYPWIVVLCTFFILTVGLATGQSW